MNDLVSIIMPSYNTAQYIARSIQSVINQTYVFWELLIVDDCSTDNTDTVVAAFNDKRIKYEKNEENIGAALTRNRALREAKGRWVAFLDSDDLWMPEKLEKQIYYMEKNGYAFSFTDYRIQLNGQWLPYVNTAPNIITKQILFKYCYLSTITVMYDRGRIGLIQIADIRKNNDYAMWFEAIDKSNFFRLPECLSLYIKHADSISSGSKIKLIKYYYLMYRIALKKGRIQSALLTVYNLFHGVTKKIWYRRPAKTNESL